MDEDLFCVDEPGTRFTICHDRIVGAGAESTLFAVQQQNSDQVVVAKQRVRVAYKKAADGGSQPLEAPPEVVLHGALPRHPNIQQVLAWFATKHHVYVVMPLAEKDLFAAVVESRVGLRDSQCKSIFRDVLEGVACMHAHGWVHADIKLENVLLFENKRAVLTDFGAAYRVGAPQPRRLKGTVAYAAPETQGFYKRWTPVGPSTAAMTVGRQSKSSAGGAFQHLRAQLSSLQCLPRVPVCSCPIGVGGSIPPLELPPPALPLFDAVRADMWTCGVLLLQMMTAAPVENGNVATALGYLRRQKRPQAVVDLVHQLLHHNPLRRPLPDDILVNNTWLARA